MTNSSAMPRLLVVEDEYLIRMLLEDMLDDLGYGIAAAVGTLSEARQIAADGDFNAAILDVNLDGQEIYPVADILTKRGLPFVFVSGYPDQARPAFRVRHRLWRAQPAGALSRSPCPAETFSGRTAEINARRVAGLVEDLCQLRHKGFIGEIEPQRCERNTVFRQSSQIAAWRRTRNATTREGDPIVGISTSVVARIDA